MAITLLASANTPLPTVAADWTLQAAQLTACKFLLGKANVPFTGMDNLVVPSLALGTYIFHAGAVYIVDTANFPIAAGTLVGAGQYYVKVTTSGVTLTAEWVSAIAAYSWDESNQGLYNGTSQILSYAMYYDGAASYYKRQLFNIANASLANLGAVRNDGLFEIPELSVSGDVDVGNDLDVTGDADIVGSVGAKEYNPKALIASSMALSAISTTVIPAGVYQAQIVITTDNVCYAKVETFINGGWVNVDGSYFQNTGSSPQFTCISDGTNTRFSLTNEAGTSLATLYLSKY